MDGKNYLAAAWATDVYKPETDTKLAAELLKRLGEERMKTVACLNSVGSTNDYIKALAQGDAPPGTVAIAKQQTAGRGRLGRSFQSQEGMGVYLSLLLRPDCPLQTAAQLTAWTAVAVGRAVERVCSVKPRIKWVNDLVLNGRKLAGILTEAGSEGESGSVRYAVVGVGVNLGQESFSPELRDIATSLLMETGKHFSRSELAAAMIQELDEMRSGFPGEKAQYLQAYRQNCVNIGRSISYTVGGETRIATAQGIDRDFGLIVADMQGNNSVLSSGEVSVRGLYGYL